LPPQLLAFRLLKENPDEDRLDFELFSELVSELLPNSTSPFHHFDLDHDPRGFTKKTPGSSARHRVLFRLLDVNADNNIEARGNIIRTEFS
jgi:hypothetical protein